MRRRLLTILSVLSLLTGCAKTPTVQRVDSSTQDPMHGIAGTHASGHPATAPARDVRQAPPTTSEPTDEERAWPEKPWPVDVSLTRTGGRALVSVYVWAARGGTEEKGMLPWLLVGVWRDGTVVWSDDPIEGGPPYFEGKVTPEAVSALVRRMTDLAAESKVPITAHHVAPDYLRTIIQVRTPAGRYYTMGSWHEIQEGPRDRVMLDRRSVKLGPGQNHAEVLRARGSEEYVRFRDLWSAMRSAIAEAMPPDRWPTGNGVVTFETVRR